MLYKIARKIKTDYLDSLSFADRTGGLVRVMNDHRKSEKSYPIEFNQNKVLGDNQYMRKLVPDSRYKSVMYFEQGSSPTVTEQHNNWYGVEAQLKLVVWFNYQEIDPDMYDPTYLISEVVQAIPFKIGNFECLVGVTCSYAGQDTNDGSIFSQYTFNEPESQFYKYPYDYFVLNFDVSYRVVTNCYQEDLSLLPIDPVLITMKSGANKSLQISGVSGKEYQIEVYGTGDVTITASALHEFSGALQTYSYNNAVVASSYVKIDYGREYLRSIDVPDMQVTNITIPDDDNIRLEYIDLSGNNIVTEQYLIDLVDHLYDTEVNNGTLDISGGTNAAMTDLPTLAKMADMIATRGWTITNN